MKYLDVPQSGSAGNMTASRNRSGQYYRQRSLPTQPRTTAQLAARSRLTTLSAAWRGLTAAQMAAWAGFANSFSVVNNLGQTIQLTGHQCYVKVNAVNLLLGVAASATPPALPTFAACAVTALTGTAGTPALDLNGAAQAAGTDQMVYVSPQLSAGVSYNGRYAYIGKSGTYAAGKYSILSLYTAKYGTLVVGKKIFVKVVQNQAGMQDNGTVFTVTLAT